MLEPLFDLVEGQSLTLEGHFPRLGTLLPVFSALNLAFFLLKLFSPSEIFVLSDVK